ncbi:MAG: molybdopterin molybdotransferase MoeA [Halothiobacillaceae bacterium]|nr:MAG: molybdopterin molybdotransferase MoeA [Halothiobacillaceae bacterium]
MLDFAAARERLLAAARGIERVETLPIEACLGRILAEDARALSDSPPGDVSTLDGYAIAVRDLAPAGETRLRVTQRIAAGQTGGPLEPGSAARIFTGAAMPPGADAIVAQEAARREGDEVVFARHPAPFEDVRRQGEDFRSGAVLVPAGTRLAPAHLGLAASGGIDRCSVFGRLRVALLTTGDEVVPPGQPLHPGQIYNANAPLLSGLLQQLGCEISHVEHLPDHFDTTLDGLKRIAPACDVILTSGGVSVGEEDHVKSAVEHLGTLDMWKVRMKPGKPLAFGHVLGTPFIGLPGNPVSGFVTFLLFARPFLLASMGATTPAPRPIRLPAAFARPRASERREFARGRITADQRVELYANQGSGILSSLGWAEVLVELPENETLAPGDPVNTYLLAELMA